MYMVAGRYDVCLLPEDDSSEQVGAKLDVMRKNPDILQTDTCVVLSK